MQIPPHVPNVHPVLLTVAYLSVVATAIAIITAFAKLISSHSEQSKTVKVNCEDISKIKTDVSDMKTQRSAALVEHNKLVAANLPERVVSLEEFKREQVQRHTELSGKIDTLKNEFTAAQLDQAKSMGSLQSDVRHANDGIEAIKRMIDARSHSRRAEDKLP